MILGLLEARLLSFDRVLLAGLDETVWPPAVETDAFLNRPMRAALALSAPERRIGQTAHDFVEALGAREAILSRAKKRGGQPTVASRFLQRMAAAAGPLAMEEPEERGELYLGFARALDRPTAFQPQRRPAPRPAAELRPKALSVTRIETLRRDPYAIYAEYILRLKALETVEREIGPRETGMAWHAALQLFVEAYPSGALPPEARDRLLSMARTCFALLSGDPSFALHWPNIEKGLDFFLAFERDTRGLDRASLGRAAGRPSPAARKWNARSSSARGRIGSIFCDRAARGSSTTKAERRPEPRTSSRVFRRN